MLLVHKSKMEREDVEEPPVLALLLVFFTYGGVLVCILTMLLWQWSGMASLGLAYLVLVAPVVMGIVASHNHSRRGISHYHKAAYVGGLLYDVVFIVLLLLWFVVGW